MSRKFIAAAVILCGLSLTACQNETAPDDRLSAIETTMTTKKRYNKKTTQSRRNTASAAVR